MKSRIILSVMLAASSLPSVSEVLRSVDKDGNVTFSDQPVPGSVEETAVVIDAPPPSRQEVRESEQQAREMIRRADQLGQEIDSGITDRAASIKAAQMNLDSATARLREVQVVRAGDRQALAGGGTRLRPEYLERVQDAEEQVMEAQKKLDAAKRARP
ncbi:MAG: DUF4124 domain-containing protein [Gammaproteobacteria bacterium]|jgi:hypothetical protein